MSHDGAKGPVDMHEARAWTIAQDESSSLVYGMPRVPFQTAQGDQANSLMDISQNKAQLIQKGRRTAVQAAAPT